MIMAKIGGIGEYGSDIEMNFLVNIIPVQKHYSAKPFCMVIPAATAHDAEKYAMERLKEQGMPVKGYFFDAYIQD